MLKIFEVGPRDGLQNEKQVLSLEAKLAYVEGLVAAGLKDIEAGSFVRPDRIPQMQDSDALFLKLHEKGYLSKKNLNFWAAVPNEKGLERAVAAKCKAVAVFTGATDTFTQKNIGMTMKESIRVFDRVVSQAKKEKIKVRGYVSVVWGCPYEGEVKPKAVLNQVRALFDMGISQVSLGDTIGVATPLGVKKMLASLKKEIAKQKVAVHFHDTRGTALANCLLSFQEGVRTFDSSSAGLGGCNYAPGASGNVATEDLLYMFHGMREKTGIDLEKLCAVSREAIHGLGRIPTSRYLQAWLSSHTNSAGT